MKFLLVLIGLSVSLCGNSQLFGNISTFTTQDGLSNNTITCLQKDSAGFLWIGTHEGLNRYDGTAFANVLSNQQNNLPSNNINNICIIDNTTIAIATDAGLCLLNTETLKGKKIDLPFNKDFSGTGYLVEDLLYDKIRNELWVGTWHGLFVLNKEGVLQKKLLAPADQLIKASFAKSLLMDDHRAVYFFSMQTTGFYYPDFNKNDIIPVEQKNPSFKFNEYIKRGFVVRSAQMLDHESICIISKFSPTDPEDYIFYQNLSSGRNFIDKLTVNFAYEKRIANAFPISDSVFLVNSYFGEPLIYNTNNHQLRMASDHPLWFSSWPDGIGITLFKDKQYTWIATAKGLLQSSEKTSSFKSNSFLTNTVTNDKGLVSFNYALYDSNKLWLSCMGAGLFSLDTACNKIATVFGTLRDPALTKKMVSTSVFNAGSSLLLYSIYGPAQVNKSSLKVNLVAGTDKDASFDDLASFPLEDSKGNIWSTIPDGITRYTIATQRFTNFKSRYHGGNFPLLRAGPKTEDGKGNIWMTRQDTLIKFDPVANKFTYTLLSKNGKSLRPVSLLASDGDNGIYVSVAGTFCIYNITTDSVSVFTKQTGIISTAINDLVADRQGNAWIATEAGLVFYNKQKKKFSSYTKADGLPDDNVVAVNFADVSRKTLFIGFTKGYCLLEPANFLLEKSVPQNRIMSIEVNGDPLANSDHAPLSYKQNSISFTYTGVNFNQGQQNNYACILEGFDQDWKFQGAERRINYVNLPPGKYTFKVKSANHQGEWNEQPAIFYFEIKPPFWQRWWFIGILLAAAAFGLIYFVKVREASLQRENTIKLQMSELRMQALRAQMNPHFIFNSLNSIQNYILSNNTMDAASYLSKFAKLMRRILDQSKHNFLPLGEVMETLRMYVEIEAFRFNNEFTYTFHVEEDDDLLDARIPPMLLQPFVENAILHGLMPKTGDKKLIIDCRFVNSQIVITIDDNGVGRDNLVAKAGHDSQGQKLTEGMLESLQQIKNIKASIEFIDKKENEKPVGTTVKLVFAIT